MTERRRPTKADIFW